jgi:hypothetical protein
LSEGVALGAGVVELFVALFELLSEGVAIGEGSIAVCFQQSCFAGREGVRSFPEVRFADLVAEVINLGVQRGRLFRE